MHASLGCLLLGVMTQPTPAIIEYLPPGPAGLSPVPIKAASELQVSSHVRLSNMSPPKSQSRLTKKLPEYQSVNCVRNPCMRGLSLVNLLNSATSSQVLGGLRKEC